jgi:hypothetical protein
LFLYVIENEENVPQKVNPKAPVYFETAEEAAKKLHGLSKEKQAGLKVQAYSLVKAVIV